MFELMKAKSEARKVRREAIEAIELDIRNKTIELLAITDAESRKANEESIARMAAIREVLRKKQEPSKIVCTLVDGGVHIGGVLLAWLLKERMMNTGTGDKFAISSIDQMIKKH